MPTLVAPQKMIFGLEFGHWRQRFLANSQEQFIFPPASSNLSRPLANSALAVFSQTTRHDAGSR
jgi:hypothetical protein